MATKEVGEQDGGSLLLATADSEAVIAIAAVPPTLDQCREPCRPSTATFAFSCLRGFLEPKVLILPMTGYEFQKTGSSPQPMNDGGKWGCSSLAPTSQGDSAPRSTWLLASTLFLGFLPFPGLLLCSPVRASWNHLLNQLPVSRSSSQVCSWSNRNWNDHTEAKPGRDAGSGSSSFSSTVLFCFHV